MDQTGAYSQEGLWRPRREALSLMQLKLSRAEKMSPELLNKVVHIDTNGKRNGKADCQLCIR
ncbi:Hypothetical predicted protein [Podarcis lilfordi]|uniref:Uncharacterized protein n=1 Tax=Podarcis lilfordi TaxID=74358 RepID=A0AA35K5B5_9SAUR|nr:Hypothetical predicted protein [Podarcis lilfordi]